MYTCTDGQTGFWPNKTNKKTAPLIVLSFNAL